MESIGQRILRIYDSLDKTYPDAKCELDYRGPLQLLVAAILSAQCTDAKVNEITPSLFSKYRTAKDFAKANASDLERMVRSTGFFKNKARAIQNCCTQLTMEFAGEVPEGMDELVSLTGVGRKTANLIRGEVYGKPALVCDTHFIRVTQRLELTKEKDPEKIEKDIAAILPEDKWTRFSILVTIHGRRCCSAKKPSCGSCSIAGLCPAKGL